MHHFVQYTSLYISKLKYLIYFKDQYVPIISYTNSIVMINYNHVLHDLGFDELISEKCAIQDIQYREFKSIDIGNTTSKY